MRLDPQQMLKLVDGIELFDGLSDREKNTLLAIVRAQEYSPGEELCREGDRGFSFFIVCRGTVAIYKEISAANRECLGEIGPGSMIGQVSLIDGKPRSATVTAKSRVITLECTRDDFERLFNAGSPFAFKILEQCVEETDISWLLNRYFSFDGMRCFFSSELPSYSLAP